MSLRSLFQAGAIGVALLPSATSATLLYAASYAGKVTTLDFFYTKSGPAHADIVAASSACAPNPSWLTLDKSTSTLYCLNEGLRDPNGSLVAFRKSANGSLTPLYSITTPKGPVSGVIYGSNGSGIALAEYSGSSISAYSLASNSTPTKVHEESFRLARPGPNANRQDASHPHQAILDPTGNFLIVPDLGADLVRVWNIDQKTLALAASTPLVAAPGSGPRHVAFLKTEAKTFMYLISELANTVTAYEVTYKCDGSLAFNQVFITNTHGSNSTLPDIVTAAEIHISPDNRFILVTSRGESSTSDPLITFSINPETGALTFVQTVPTYGSDPRQFSINKAGTLVAVGTQGDGQVIIFDRNVTSGFLTRAYDLQISGGIVTCVIFDE